MSAHVAERVGMLELMSSGTGVHGKFCGSLRDLRAPFVTLQTHQEVLCVTSVVTVTPHSAIVPSVSVSLAVFLSDSSSVSLSLSVFLLHFFTNFYSSI